MENSVLQTNTELFVTNKLQGKDLTDFLSEIEKNSKLKNEVLLQKSIINQVKVARKAELKARLNNIPTPISNTGSNTFIKYAASVIITASIGTAVYFYFSQDNEIDNEIAQVATIEKVNIKEEEVVSKIEKSKEIEPKILNEEKEKIYTKKETKKTEKIQVERKSKATPNSHLIADNSDIDEVNMPSKEMASTPKETISGLEIKKESDIDIKNIKEEGYKFHYQLKENSLFLYGNFDASPYEILEFNDKNGQQLYLYYDNSYFDLQKNQPEIVKLKKIKNESKIADLNRARAKKK